MSGFTKGPWKHVARDRGFVRVRDEIVSAGGVVVVDDVARPEDARLIAAAPQLLETLREVVQKFDAAPDVVKNTPLGIMKARAAIAAATGGAA